MAKQVGEYRFEGTVDGICFYKMEGEYYARRESSLTGKRFWKAACFAASRNSCKRLSRGSQLAALVYNNFRKQQGMYAALKTKAITLLKKNTREEKIVRKLLQLAVQLQPARQHRSKYISLYPLKITKENTLAPVFHILKQYEIPSKLWAYLSSA